MSKNQVMIYITKTETRDGDETYFMRTSLQKSDEKSMLLFSRGKDGLPLPSTLPLQYPFYLNEFKRILKMLFIKNIKVGGIIDYKMQFNQEYFITGRIMHSSVNDNHLECYEAFYTPLSKEEIYFFAFLMFDSRQIE